MTEALKTAEEREAFYDAEIAPHLGELMRKCADAGLSMMAVVEFDKTADGVSIHGYTRGLATDASDGIRWMDVFVRCGANFERYAMSFTKHIVSNNVPHSSMYLSLLGIKPSPEDRGVGDLKLEALTP